MMLSHTKKVWILAGLLACALAVVAGRYYFRRPLQQGIPVSGGIILTTRIATPLFKQWDPAWADEALGRTSFSMGSSGCTVCSLAMALASRGFHLNPSNLNRQLAEHEGFTSSGLVIWSGVGAVTNGRVSVRLNDRPTHELIDSQLAVGNPLLAKVLYDGRVWHWVLITGKSARNYLINDPLSPGPEHELMSEYPRGIYAVRYLEIP